MEVAGKLPPDSRNLDRIPLETDLTAKAETRRHFVLIRRRVAVRPVAQLPACVIAQKGENDETSIKPYLRATCIVL